MTQRIGIPQTKNVAGDVFESFTRLNDLIQKNDGIRSFSCETNNCYDSDQNFTDDQQTHIRITNSSHDINQLNQSFLRFEFDATVSLNADITGSTAVDATHAPTKMLLMPLMHQLRYSLVGRTLMKFFDNLKWRT